MENGSFTSMIYDDLDFKDGDFPWRTVKLPESKSHYVSLYYLYIYIYIYIYSYIQL